MSPLLLISLLGLRARLETVHRTALFLLVATWKVSQISCWEAVTRVDPILQEVL